MLLTQALNLMTVLAWSLLAIIVITTLIRKARRDGLGGTLREILRWRNVLLLLLAIALTILARSLVFIQPQEVGVVVSLVSPNGYRERPVRSGLLWLAPLMEEVHRYPISWQTYTMSRTPVEGERVGDDAIIARSADGQEVAIDCSVIYQVTPEQAVRIHIEWQHGYQENFVRAVTRGMVRSIVSNYNAEGINSDRRQALEQEIDDKLRAIFKDKGFTLDRFVLRNVAFSPEFAAAIERKQVEQEGVKRSEHEADQIRTVAQGRADEVRFRAQAEADAILLKAEAEAEALRKIAAALEESPDLLSYRYIDKLAPNVRVMLVPNDAPYILPLNGVDLEGAPAPTSGPQASAGTPAPGVTAAPATPAAPTITPTAQTTP